MATKKMGPPKLTRQQARGIALAKEQGELVRYCGGYWSAPGEPTDDGLPRRWVGTQTVHALERLGLLAIGGRITEAGKALPVTGASRSVVA